MQPAVCVPVQRLARLLCGFKRKVLLQATAVPQDTPHTCSSSAAAALLLTAGAATNPGTNRMQLMLLCCLLLRLLLQTERL
jgi:hypothetical protein